MPGWALLAPHPDATDWQSVAKSNDRCAAVNQGVVASAVVEEDRSITPVT
jgi:hypothetical protein